jgi:hypothetical protein
MAHQDPNRNNNNKNNNDSQQQLSDSQPQDPLHFLRHAKFSANDAAPTSAEDNQPLTASDLLLGAYDPIKLHPLAQINDHLDYLSLDDDKSSDLPGAETVIPSRGWRDDLCYGTGTMYLSGSSPFHQYCQFPLPVRFVSSSKGLRFTHFPINSCPQLSYCFIHHVLISIIFKVWLWAACGVYVRALEDLWPCQTLDCGSIVSSILSLEGVPS